MAKRVRGRTYGGVDPEARAAERREKLLAAGRQLFGARGYHQATVKQLCTAAGLTERYFYESFENTEALLLAVYRRIIEQLRERTLLAVAQVPPEPEAMARAALTAYFRSIRDDAHAARLMLMEVLGVSPRVDQAYRTTMADFADLLLELARPLLPGGRLPKGDEGLVATGLVGAAVHIAFRWLLTGCEQPLEVVVDSTMVIFLSVVRDAPAARLKVAR
ncbi:MAG: TetR/AcrR family transcriptional regulator [Myxococcaceae bacterium]|nr:TetR/AcrR family transcriptional regulator [Myxococcaceae bacterium]